MYQQSFPGILASNYLSDNSLPDDGCRGLAAAEKGSSWLVKAIPYGTPFTRPVKATPGVLDKLQTLGLTPETPLVHWDHLNIK